MKKVYHSAHPPAKVNNLLKKLHNIESPLLFHHNN